MSRDRSSQRPPFPLDHLPPAGGVLNVDTLGTSNLSKVCSAFSESNAATMRPPARLLGPLEAPSLQLSKSLYVCSTCRQEFLPRAASLQFRRNASENLPFTERVRRKIWGTDNPPGLKDPYGGEGAIERALRKRREAKGLVEEEPQPSPEVQEEIAPPADYKHAETWDGLENMGHLGRWYELSPTEADEYNG